MTLSWAGTIVSAAFESATSIEVQLEALPANAARLNYNRFRAEVDGEEVGEFGTTPGRYACCLLGPAHWRLCIWVNNGDSLVAWLNGELH